MTDWLRYIGWSIVSLFIALGLLGVGWLVASKRKLANYRSSDEYQQHITESRVGWWADPICRLCGAPKSTHTKSPADWRTVPGCTGSYATEAEE